MYNVWMEHYYGNVCTLLLLMYANVVCVSMEHYVFMYGNDCIVVFRLVLSVADFTRNCSIKVKCSIVLVVFY